MTRLVQEVRSALAEVGDPERAAGQQRYMKSALPYRGLRSPELTRLLTPILDGDRCEDREEWETAIRELVAGATHREEWYAAVALTRHRFYRAWRQAPESLGLYDDIVRRTAWWDVVDEIASHPVGEVLAAHRDAATPVIERWASDDHLWIRRTAVLAQLNHRDLTDVGLLERVLDANLERSRHGSEFFIRKAVGWALRQHARIDEAWVRAYVLSRRDRLSGLSVREATKHLR